MPYRWPEDTDFALWELDVLDRDCPACGRMMHVCDHRYRRFHTLDGPVATGLQAQPLPRSRAAPGTPRPRAPSSRSPSPCPSWAIGWDVFCWIGHRRCLPPLVDPPDPSRTPRRLRASSSPKTAIDQYIRRYQVMLAARQQDPEALRRHYEAVERDHPLDRRPPAREGARDPLRRPGADREAGLVRRAVALGHRGRGPTPDREGQGVGRVPGQAGGALDVGQAGRVRHGDRGGIPRRAASLLRQPLPPRPGQAGPGGRQPCQGPDAEEGPRPADDRTGRAPAAEGRDRRTTSRPRLRKPPARRPRRRTRLLPWSIPPAPWCSTIARRCAGSSTTIKGGRCIRPGCGWPRRWARSGSRSNGTWTRKRGVRGGATRPAGRMHRQRAWTKSRSSKRSIREYVAVIAEVAATLEPGTEDITERQEQFEALIDRFEATEDPIRHGMADGDAQLPGRPVRRRGGRMKRSGTISIWSGGFACPRVTSGGSTVIATRGFGWSWKGRRWCMRWTPTRRIPSRSPWTTCCRIGRPASRRASVRR